MNNVISIIALKRLRIMLDWQKAIVASLSFICVLQIASFITMLRLNANWYLGVIDMTLWQCVLWIVLMMTAVGLSSVKHKRMMISYTSIALCVIALITGILTWCLFSPQYSYMEAQTLLNMDQVYDDAAICEDYSTIGTTNEIGFFISKGYVFRVVTAGEKEIVELFFNPVTGDYYKISK